VLSDAPPLTRVAVTKRDLDRYPPDSVQRALLGYWSRLQYSAWNGAAADLDPVLRRFFGDETLLAALRYLGPTTRLGRPHVSAVVPAGNRAKVEYLATRTNGRVIGSSGSWRRANGRWLLYHDSLIDEALQGSAQARTQAQIPHAPGTTSPQAVAAGARMATEELRYLRSVPRP
jgi:hypothetical protein